MFSVSIYERGKSETGTRRAGYLTVEIRLNREDTVHRDRLHLQVVSLGGPPADTER